MSADAAAVVGAAINELRSFFCGRVSLAGAGRCRTAGGTFGRSTQSANPLFRRTATSV